MLVLPDNTTAAAVTAPSALSKLPSVQLPPTAWVSSVLSHLPHSVDVDSVTTYTQLLQNCLVLQPALLHTPPDQAGTL